MVVKMPLHCWLIMELQTPSNGFLVPLMKLLRSLKNISKLAGIHLKPAQVFSKNNFKRKLQAKSNYHRELTVNMKN